MYVYIYSLHVVHMANVYVISLPDELKPVADQLVSERRLSGIIAGLLTNWYNESQKKKNK